MRKKTHNAKNEQKRKQYEGNKRKIIQIRIRIQTIVRNIREKKNKKQKNNYS